MKKLLFGLFCLYIGSASTLYAVNNNACESFFSEVAVEFHQFISHQGSCFISDNVDIKTVSFDGVEEVFSSRLMAMVPKLSNSATSSNAFIIPDNIIYAAQEGNELFGKAWVIGILIDIAIGKAGERDRDPGPNGIDAHPSENDGNNRYQQDKESGNSNRN